MNKRKALKIADLQSAEENVRHKVSDRLKDKGYGVYASPHEVHGLLSEEMQELNDAMGLKDKDQFEKELIDVAVICIIALASDLPPDTPARSEEEQTCEYCLWIHNVGNYSGEEIAGVCGNTKSDYWKGIMSKAAGCNRWEERGED